MDRVKGANQLATSSLNIAHRHTHFGLAPYCVFKQSESSPIFGNRQIFLKLQALASLEKTQLCFLGPGVLIATICWRRRKFTQVPIIPHSLPDPETMRQLPFIIMLSLPLFF